jgi:aryl-alcohol dehydrogenase-like predicted oxidoreductase
VLQRQLGKDGPRIPELMFGAWPIGGGLGTVEEQTARAAIDRALDLGITAIDTAEFYRESEAILGRALAGRPRDQLFLATKVSTQPYTRARMREALDNSLRALGTDYVDLYQLHEFPRGVSLEEAMEGLAEARQSGKVRFVGVSNFNVEQLAAAHALYPIQSIQPLLNIFDRQALDDLVPFCREHGIGVIVYSPLAKGLITAKYQPGHVFAPDDERSHMRSFQGERFAQFLAAADDLAPIARAKGITLTQLAIAWTLVDPAVTSCIVGIKTAEQAEEPVGAVGVTFTAEELARIAEIGARAPGSMY